MAIEQCLKTDDAILDFGSLAESGRSYTRTITIKNDCEHEIEVSGSFSGGEGESSAKDWLAFVGGKNKLKMKAKSQADVEIRDYLPAKVDEGSYYAMLHFKNDSSEQFDDEFGDVLNISVRMDVLGDVSAVSGNLATNSANLLSFGGKVAAKAVVENTGKIGFVATYKLEKSPAFGLEEYEVLVEDEAEVAAGEEKSFDAREETDGQYGVYKLRQTVSYINGDGEHIESELLQTVVNLPWLAVCIAVGVVIALVLFSVTAKAIKISRREKKNEKKRKNSEEEE